MSKQIRTSWRPRLRNVRRHSSLGLGPLPGRRVVKTRSHNLCLPDGGGVVRGTHDYWSNHEYMVYQPKRRSDGGRSALKGMQPFINYMTIYESRTGRS